MTIGLLKCMACGSNADKIRITDIGDGIIANIPVCFSCFWMTDEEAKKLIKNDQPPKNIQKANRSEKPRHVLG